MYELLTYDLCSYRNLALQNLIDDLNAGEAPGLRTERTGILFLGDGLLAPPVRPTEYTHFFVVSLSDYPCIYSDLVVPRKVSYEGLKRNIVGLLRGTARRRRRSAPVDEFTRRGSMVRNSNSFEEKVLGFLLQGYTLKQTAEKTGLSYQTVSQYKIKAVERFGFRNFNALLAHHFKMVTL